MVGGIITCAQLATGDVTEKTGREEKEGTGVGLFWRLRVN